MFLSVRNKATQKIALQYKVVDMDTGKDIPHVVWANDTTGRYRQLIVDENQRYVRDGNKKRAVSKIFKGNIRLVRV